MEGGLTACKGMGDIQSHTPKVLNCVPRSALGTEDTEDRTGKTRSLFS